MKRSITFFAGLFFIAFNLPAQTDSVRVMEEIKAFQEELNQEYRDAEKSPLKPEERALFREHEFFTPNLAFRTEAKLVKAKKPQVFKMKTSGTRQPDYRKYGDLHFELNGKSCKLEVYQSVDLAKKEAYKDYLFLPFTDLTTGDETYGGGGYIDLRIPKGKTLILDFNKAYNPYCAYTPGYSCPVPPRENHLDISIEAGIKKPAETH
jgi:uncharacterized protein